MEAPGVSFLQLLGATTFFVALALFIFGLIIKKQAPGLRDVADQFFKWGKGLVLVLELATIITMLN